MQEPIKVVIADDHKIFRDGFKVLVRKQPALKIIGEAANGKELITVVDELNPDVVITDIQMPVMDGIEATITITKNYPQVGVIALSMFNDDNLVIDMLDAGATGYILKNTTKEEVLEAVKTVHAGKTFYCEATSMKLARLIGRTKQRKSNEKKPVFNNKEIEIIKYICQEYSSREIGEKMNMSMRTIEGYREIIMEKMDVKNIAGIVIYAIRAKIFSV